MPPSSSDDTTFQLLDERIRRWIWEKGWHELRDIQARAIHEVLESDRDILIAAATASGKTEAAFLPVLSRIVERPRDGIRALYVGPLKALINDQFSRLEDLCDRLEIPVTKWHGDAAASGKERAREHPAGVLLITPESLEAIFMRRPENLNRMFAETEFVVVDELHAFLNSERGVQLASLFRRLECRTQRRPRRIGLSATIGDLAIAAKWLNPRDPASVSVIQSDAAAATLQLQIRGVLDEGRGKKDDEGEALQRIARHLFATLRARGNHLIFAGSRRNTEALSDRLRVLSEQAGVPNEFFPHHGNLSRPQREWLEERLRAGAVPTTAVATTTLELGIDVGSVESVAQVGAPASISSLRQRLGRSGRRAGKPAVLRLYAIERPLAESRGVFDRLRIETVQTIAAIQLLLERWIEPPSDRSVHLSTLLHQTLSLICERGGVLPQALFEILGGPGPFSNVSTADFAALLQGVADRNAGLIEQAPDRTLMLGERSEKLTSFYQFFAVFESTDEYTIVAEGKALGTLSVTNALGPDDFLIFAGRRWKVQSVDDRARKVFVAPAPSGEVPKFEGEAAPLHDMLCARMEEVYRSADVPVYLDAEAKLRLEEGRSAFVEMGLNRSPVFAQGHEVYLFPWVGTQKLDTLRLALKYAGLSVDQGRAHLCVLGVDIDRVEEVLSQLAQTTPPAASLAFLTDKLRIDKFDDLIPDALLRQGYIRDRLKVYALPDLAKRLLDAPP